MTRKTVIHVCSFQAGDDIKPRTKYETVKAAAVKAGRFSCFEATASKRAAEIFTALGRDPDVEVYQMPYPWMGVRLATTRKPTLGHSFDANGTPVEEA